MEQNSNDNSAPDMTLRDEWGNRVTACYKLTKEAFDREAKYYVRAYRNEFIGTVSQRILSSERVDVNLVYQVIKTLLPILYFKNPKVFVKALQEKINQQVTQVIDTEEGEQVVPLIVNGKPLVQEYDAVKSALVLQSAINENIKKADLKYEVKSAIEDALLCFYGAVKTGWGNDQGVASMGEGAPPSIREDVYDDAAYGIRLKPWDVVVDPTDFYHPNWIAVRYVVPPEQLKNDSRLRNTEELKGNTKIDDHRMQRVYELDPKNETKMVEYFEIFVKPCAKYPEGKYFIFSEEAKKGFLYEAPWPIKSKTFPVKLLYFNRDPEGGLPMPDVRYFMGHQKAKLNLRNAEYEYVQRTMPGIYMNMAGMKDAEIVKKQITSQGMPRVVTGNQPAGRAVQPITFPSLGSDFYRMDLNVDNDVARIMGLLGPVAPSVSSDQTATGLKIASSGEQVRQQERMDIVADFIETILLQWVDLYKEFAGPENYSPIEGESFPVKWSREEIQGNFSLEVKPFSMSYEDPTVRRRQYVDLLNLLSAPAVQMSLQQQGFEIDTAKIVQRVLETYEERDVETFMNSVLNKPEMQVMDALRENEALIEGNLQEVAVMPEDNHKLHIMIHGLLGEAMAGHILEHQQAMSGVVPGKPGGGNPEGLPTKGVATDQEMLRQPLQPSAVNSEAAQAREATNTR